MIKTFVISTKGGVGKTMTAGNLAVFLATNGFRVLAIDVDPQGSLTTFLGINKSIITQGTQPSIAEVLTVKDFDITEAIQNTVTENLDVLPACGTLREANDKILISKNWIQHTRLRKALKKVEDHYDFAVMDSAPTHDMAVQNAIVAADNLLIPISVDDFSFEATEELFSLTAEMEEYNSSLLVIGCFASMFRPRLRVYEVGLCHLKSAEHLKMFETVVRLGVAANESTFTKQAAILGAPSSIVAQDYVNLFGEYLERCEKIYGGS